ncbi:hypothetical protein EJB05_07588, partial [Eragrostis curvula]
MADLRAKYQGFINIELVLESCQSYPICQLQAWSKLTAQPFTQPKPNNAGKTRKTDRDERPTPPSRARLPFPPPPVLPKKRVACCCWLATCPPSCPASRVAAATSSSTVADSISSAAATAEGSAGGLCLLSSNNKIAMEKVSLFLLTSNVVVLLLPLDEIWVEEWDLGGISTHGRLDVVDCSKDLGTKSPAIAKRITLTSYLSYVKA